MSQSYISQYRLLLLCVFISSWGTMQTAVPAEEKTQGELQANRYTHLLYRHHVRNEAKRRLEGEIVLHKLPYFDESDKIQLHDRRVIAKSEHLPLFVQQGKLIASGYMASLHAIDLKTGESRELSKHQVVVHPHADQNSLYTVTTMGHQLQRFDLKTGDFARVFRDEKSFSTGGSQFHRFALHAPSQQLAVAMVTPKSKDDFWQASSKLHIFDLSGDAVKTLTIEKGLLGQAVMGGAAFPKLVAPPIFWKDATTLLAVIGQEPPQQNEVLPAGVGLIVGNSRWDLVQIDATSGEIETVCQLPPQDFQLGMNPRQFEFWKRADGQILLRSLVRGDYRIDLKGKSLISDRRLSKHYELKGDFASPSLWSRGELLGENLFLQEISISPDGNQIVWLGSPPGRRGFAGSTRTLFYHSPATGKLNLVTSDFRHGPGYRPVNELQFPAIQWLADVKLEGEQ